MRPSCIKSFIFLSVILYLSPSCTQPTSASLLSGSDGTCELPSRNRRSFERLSIECQEKILKKLTEFEIVQWLRETLADRTLQITSPLLKYLSTKAQKVAPNDILTNNPNPMELSKAFVRSFFRFYDAKVADPKISVIPDFCNPGGRQGHACAFVLPLSRHGVIGFGTDGTVSVVSVDSHGGNPQKLVLGINVFREANAGNQVKIVEVTQYKAGHFLILIHGTGPQALLLQAILTNNRDLAISNRALIDHDLRNTVSIPVMTAFEDIFVVAFNGKMIVGTFGDAQAHKTKSYCLVLQKIWPYDKEYIVALEGGRPFLVNLANPNRLKHLPRPLGSIISYNDLIASEKIINTNPNDLKLVSAQGLRIQINRGVFSSEFVAAGKAVSSQKILKVPPGSLTYPHLVEVTQGVWGAVDYSGKLVIIDGWH